MTNTAVLLTPEYEAWCADAQATYIHDLEAWQRSLADAEASLRVAKDALLSFERPRAKRNPQALDALYAWAVSALGQANADKLQAMRWPAPTHNTSVPMSRDHRRTYADLRVDALGLAPIYEASRQFDALNWAVQQASADLSRLRRSMPTEPHLKSLGWFVVHKLACLYEIDELLAQALVDDGVPCSVVTKRNGSIAETFLEFTINDHKLRYALWTKAIPLEELHPELEQAPFTKQEIEILLEDACMEEDAHEVLQGLGIPYETEYEFHLAAQDCVIYIRCTDGWYAYAYPCN